MFRFAKLTHPATQMHFSSEYLILINKNSISSNSATLTITPFLDAQKVMGANGHLASTLSLTYNERHPIILAYKSRLARSYVEYIHELSLHVGNQFVLRLLRLEFWISKVKNFIKTCIHNCKVCVIFCKKPFWPNDGGTATHQNNFNSPFRKHQSRFCRTI